jgi:arylsulfatase A-like enzyme
VPLLVHYPARVAPRVVDEGSEGIDVLPTILDVLGAPVDGMQGWSLRGLAAGEGAGWPQPAFASQFEYAFAVRLGRWKARVGKSGRPMIFDVDADPLERADLARERPVERRYLTDQLGLYLAFRTQWTKATWGVVSNMSERGAHAMETR